MNPRTVLVTGASGHVGAHLVPALLDAGFRVRVLARRPGNLDAHWRDRVDVVQGDASEEADMADALDGIGVAYYLLHSMDRDGHFEERDRAMARTFAAAAEKAGVRRIVYLSGLHPDGELSPHLASRVEVGRILLESTVPTAVLQAGVVLGAGSASFEMLRHLTERLPVAVGPRWLDNRIQSIALRDVLYYLVAAANLAPDVNRAIDIGMDEVLTYREMMRRYARVTGLGRRLVGTVPVLSPSLASHWVGLVTPVDSAVARPLVGSLIHHAVKRDDDAEQWLGTPPDGLLGFDDAIREATTDVDPKRWSRTLALTAVQVAACAVVGSLLSNSGSAWYRGLRKPRWQPPAAAFPAVWSGLYALITLASAATSADLEEAGRSEEARRFRRALAANLLLNAAWSGLFFRARNLPLATLGTAALAGSSADLTRRAAKAGPGKAAGMGAYTVWGAFATALTADLARRNRRGARRP